MRAYSNLSDLVKRLRSLLDLPTTRRADRPVRPSKQDQKRLAPDQIAQLVAAHQAGTGVKKLAVRFGIHRYTVHNALVCAGALRRRGIQPDDLPDVSRLNEAGWSLAQLATKFGVSPSTVNNTLRKTGMRIRRPGRPQA